MKRTPTRIAIVGAGGNAREIAAIIRDITDAGQSDSEFAGSVISELERIGAHDSIDRLLGDFDCLQSNGRTEVQLGVNAASRSGTYYYWHKKRATW